MTRIELAPEVLQDFDRILDHQLQSNPNDAPARVAEILEAIQILANSPLIGRRVKGGKRELVIGRASGGYRALYRYVSDVDVVFVLALRAQRERGYKRRRR